MWFGLSSICKQMFHGEDFQKTQLCCLGVYRKIVDFWLVPLCAMFVCTTLSPKATADKQQTKPE